MKRLTCILLTSIAATGIGAPAIGQASLPDEFREVYRESVSADTARIPIGPYGDGNVPMQIVDGMIENVVLRVEGDLSTLDLMREVAIHLESLGYSDVFDCDDRECGGFDFISQLDIVGVPDMYVDIGNFRYLATTRVSDETASFAAVIVSRSLNAGYIQITAAEETIHSLEIASAADRTDGQVDGRSGNTPPGLLTDQLLADGHAVFQTLEFATGSLSLANEASHELLELAEFLRSNPNYLVVLVGHTDTEGDLESNVELSMKRAEAVQELLVQQFQVDPEQLMAEGIGFLSPRASNADEEGRARNRRVEAILVTRNE